MHICKQPLPPLLAMYAAEKGEEIGRGCIPDCHYCERVEPGNDAMLCLHDIQTSHSQSIDPQNTLASS